MQSALHLLASMDGWKQWLVLLLALCVHADRKETVWKTIRSQPDITPVCRSENLSLIVFVICRISTERHFGEECQLEYLYDKQFDHECDSRFTLLNKNQTVFIHLTSLTPVDSGNYSCECSYERGTHATHLYITVEAGEDDRIFSGKKFISTAVISLGVATTFIIIAGIISVFILRKNHHRENIRSGSSELHRYESPQFLDQGDPYTSLQQPASDVYETIPSSFPHYSAEGDPGNIYAVVNYERDGKEKDFNPVYAVYETI